MRIPAPKGMIIPLQLQKMPELVISMLAPAKKELEPAQIDMSDDKYKSLTETCKVLLKDAIQGDPNDQYCLGIAFQHGLDGLKVDRVEAAKWFQKSADQGYAPAQRAIGVCFKKGEGVPQDLKKAVTWLQKSADQGNALGQYSLGNCFYLGEGVEEDNEQAVKWFQKSADQACPDGEYKLGICYKKGHGVPKDPIQAITLLRKAASQKYALAQKELDTEFSKETIEKRIKEVSEQIKTTPKESKLYYTRGNCYEILGALSDVLLQTESCYVRALADYQQAIRFDPTHSEAAARFAKLPEKIAEVKLKIAEERIASEEKLSLQIEAKKEEARQVRRNSLPKALDIKMVERQKHNAELMELRSQWGIKKPSEISKLYEGWILASPEEASNHREFGLFCKQAGEKSGVVTQQKMIYQKAYTHLQNALKLDPFDDEAAQACDAIEKQLQKLNTPAAATPATPAKKVLTAEDQKAIDKIAAQKRVELLAKQREQMHKAGLRTTAPKEGADACAEDKNTLASRY